jgi:hypothetical protein
LGYGRACGVVLCGDMGMGCDVGMRVGWWEGSGQQVESRNGMGWGQRTRAGNAMLCMLR